MLVSRIRRSALIHMFAVFVLLFAHLVAAPSAALACEDCWPVYYEVMSIKPSNWVTVGEYQPGDWVWIKTVYTQNGVYDTKWYVMDANDPTWWNQPDPCCANGPWYVTSEGGLYLIW